MTWSYFLVRDIDRRTLRRMKRDARRGGVSLSDLMREILCAHYELKCEPSGKPSRLEFGARTQLLRIHPELAEAIKEDAAYTGESMASLVREALSARYYPLEEEVA